MWQILMSSNGQSVTEVCSNQRAKVGSPIEVIDNGRGHYGLHVKDRREIDQEVGQGCLLAFKPMVHGANLLVYHVLDHRVTPSEHLETMRDMGATGTVLTFESNWFWSRRAGKVWLVRLHAFAPYRHGSVAIHPLGKRMACCSTKCMSKQLCNEAQFSTVVMTYEVWLYYVPCGYTQKFDAVKDHMK
ncbi:hypothetical protein Ancab_038945 [Ancistrocladus abbreviatus]